MTNSMKGLDPKALEAARLDEIEAQLPSDLAYGWERGADLEPSIVAVKTAELRALVAEVKASRLSSLPEPGAEAEGVQPVGWQGVAPDGRCDFTRKKATADDWIRKDWFIRPLYASPAFPTPASPKTRVKTLEWGTTSYGKAFTVVGTYRVYESVSGGWSASRGGLNAQVLKDGDGRTDFATQDAAKAAAQSDYEARILSALTPEAEKGDGE